MPPRVKFQKEEIVQAALTVARERGIEAVTAREVARELQVSPRPIFTWFDSMEQLRGEVRARAEEKYRGYIERGLSESIPFLGVWRQYLRFAREEPELYKLLYLTKSENGKGGATEALRLSQNMARESIMRIYRVNADTADRYFRNIWLAAYSYGTMIVMGECPYSDEEILAVGTEISLALCKAYKEIPGLAEGTYDSDASFQAIIQGSEERERMAHRYLLYRAAKQGIYGSTRTCGTAGISDALFVYLEGDPDPESAAVLDKEYRGRPWVCMTDAWEKFILKTYPKVQIYTRYLMKPETRFRNLKNLTPPEGYSLTLMDEKAFAEHPFSHGENYPSYACFRETGSGAVVTWDGKIVSSAASFLSIEGEVEMDVSTESEHRGKGLASLCIARMLEDCMRRGLVVHWDAQNDISRNLAEKYGFVLETPYFVYYMPEKEE